MRICISIFLLFALMQINARNYFVAKSGSDSNAGTVDLPYLTISKASAVMVAGDTCFIKEGVYRETLVPSQSGSVNNPIVYTRFQNDSVVISATEVVNSWQKYKGNIYRAKMSMTLGRQNMVFCQGEAMDIARWPNNTDNNKFTVEGSSVVSGTGSTIESAAIPDQNWVGGYVWYLGGHAGTSWTRQITASTTGKITFVGVDITKWPFNPHNPTIIRNNSRGQFYIFGTMNALDYPGEWFYNSTNDSVYFQAPGNVDPTTLSVEIGKRSATMNLSKNYIQVIGLSVFGGKVDISGTNCVLKNSTIKNGLHLLDEYDNSDAQVPDAAVLVRASNALIENNKIDGGSLSAVYVNSSGGVNSVTIKNNLISNFDYTGIHASPIRTSAEYVKIISNTISKTGRDGIYNSGKNCEIAYNDVSGCMMINNDGGMFYTVGDANDKNTVIHHNWFHDSSGPTYADGRVAGIYLDNNSKGYVVHHNVVWNHTWAGIQVNWDNWNIDIFNNTLFNGTAAMGRWENGYTIVDLVVKNNYASIAPYIGTDVSTVTNVISSTLPFKSLVNRDFRPISGSALIDTGEVIDEITIQYQGAKPDIGAYESGLVPWVPGVNTVWDGTVAIPDSIDPNIDPVIDPAPEDSLTTVYPNPFSRSNLNIKVSKDFKPTSYSIYNSNGQLVYQKDSILNSLILTRNDFPSQGLYLIMIETDKGRKVLRVVVS